MTAKRRYNARCHKCNVDAKCPKCGGKIPSATQFSDWLRAQKSIAASLGFATTNIDYVWHNYKMKARPWMFIEEKRHGALPSFSQQSIFDLVDNACKGSEGYKGFHVLSFEQTSPKDGSIFWDRQGVSLNELMTILRFEQE